MSSTFETCMDKFATSVYYYLNPSNEYCVITKYSKLWPDQCEIYYGIYPLTLQVNVKFNWIQLLAVICDNLSFDVLISLFGSWNSHLEGEIIESTA